MRIRVVLTVPQRVLDAEGVIDAIYNTMRDKTGPEVKKLFQLTTRGFRKRPTFNKTMMRHRDAVSVTIATGTSKSAEIYALVNAGSPPHWIGPKNSPFLRFQSGYTPASRPRYLYTHYYVRHGAYRITEGVNHPGFVAREFDQEIADQYQDTFRQDMQNAINIAAHRP